MSDIKDFFDEHGYIHIKAAVNIQEVLATRARLGGNFHQT